MLGARALVEREWQLAKGDRQWHVADQMWHNGPPGGLHVLNTDVDLFIVLCQGDVGGVASTVPDASDEWVVERIVGQYHFTATQPVPQTYFMHHRVYPTISDATSVALRDLSTADEAESDFCWHQVDPWPTQFEGDVWGDWQGETGYPVGNGEFMGRSGHVDIKVSRRIRQGEALIWHTQFVGAVAPADNEFNGIFWLRALLRQG